MGSGAKGVGAKAPTFCSQQMFSIIAFQNLTKTLQSIVNKQESKILTKEISYISKIVKQFDENKKKGGKGS